MNRSTRTPMQLSKTLTPIPAPGLVLAAGSGSKTTSLAAGASRVVPRSQVVGYNEAAHDYVVYWWHAEKDSDGKPVHGSIQTLTVTR